MIKSPLLEYLSAHIKELPPEKDKGPKKSPQKLSHLSPHASGLAASRGFADVPLTLREIMAKSSPNVNKQMVMEQRLSEAQKRIKRNRMLFDGLQNSDFSLEFLRDVHNLPVDDAIAAMQTYYDLEKHLERHRLLEEAKLHRGENDATNLYADPRLDVDHTEVYVADLSTKEVRRVIRRCASGNSARRKLHAGLSLEQNDKVAFGSQERAPNTVTNTMTNTVTAPRMVRTPPITNSERRSLCLGSAAQTTNSALQRDRVAIQETFASRDHFVCRSEKKAPRDNAAVPRDNYCGSNATRHHSSVDAGVRESECRQGGKYYLQMPSSAAKASVKLPRVACLPSSARETTERKTAPRGSLALLPCMPRLKKESWRRFIEHTPDTTWTLGANVALRRATVAANVPRRSRILITCANSTTERVQNIRELAHWPQPPHAHQCAQTARGRHLCECDQEGIVSGVICSRRLVHNEKGRGV